MTWNLGTVTTGQTKVLTFQVKVGDAANGAKIENIGRVTTAEEATATESNPTTVNVVAVPKSELVKSVRVLPSTTFASSATAKPDDTLEYKLAYKNAGSGPATGVKITEPIPANSTFVSCSDSCVDTTSGQAPTSITWNLGTVAAGASKDVTFQAKLASTFTDSSSPVKNTAIAKSNEEPDKPSNEVIVTVNAAPRLALEKKADQTTAVSGDQVTYTLTASNDGDAWATGATIKEPHPGRDRVRLLRSGLHEDGQPNLQRDVDDRHREAGRASERQAHRPRTRRRGVPGVQHGEDREPQPEQRDRDQLQPVAIQEEASAIPADGSLVSAGLTDSKSTGGTQLLGLEVAGQAVPVNVPPNTTIELPDAAFAATRPGERVAARCLYATDPGRPALGTPGAPLWAFPCDPPSLPLTSLACSRAASPAS